ncbi:MAG: isoprenylcysteine carboxylmethyltransferase family protein [Chloroflexi bacterium]|nr:isoprenylcysteine carboxylmethyltransferase family protein [Chloroflexota bacterium]
MDQRGRKVNFVRLLKRIVQVLVVVAAQAAMLFLSSWRLDWVMAWVYVGTFTVVLAAMTIYQEVNNPELVEERSEFKPREGVQTWDVILSAVVRVSLLANYVVAGLDMRFGWKPEIPLAFQIAAFGLGLLGAVLLVWAMAANRYAAVYTRIQQERGHVVVTTGPYRFVRHPFYVGTITFSLMIPLALGSPWALIPGGLAALLFIVKTAAEDRILREGLAGYREYAGRVRYRLLPGIW